MSMKPNAEKVVEQHLMQNVNQKLTPHLIAGLIFLIGQSLRKEGLVVTEQTEEPAHA